MRLPFFRAALASALTCCFASSVLAAPVGTLTSIRASNNQLDITTDQQVLLQIQLLQDDLFRLQAGLNGKLTEPGNKAAAIVLPQTPAPVEFQLSDKGDYQLLQTEKFALRIYAKPLKFALYQADIYR